MIQLPMWIYMVYKAFLIMDYSNRLSQIIVIGELAN